MVVEIFIPQGDPEDPLGQQGLLGMGDEERIAGIGNAAVQGIDQTQLAIDLPQQQGSGV